MTEKYCKHDFLIWGDKISSTVWLCWHCCGLVTYSGLAKNFIVAELQLNQRQYCQYMIQVVIDVWKKHFPDENPPPFYKLRP